ncbi:MAG: hypothetical protein Kow00121_08930 [Elainellaceae cyanobacterium]
MVDSIPGLLNPARLLFDLQHVNDIAQSISGCLEPDLIARQITDGLVDRFDCVFARIWLVEPDETALRLVASSGLYTHTNGSFARVPMGAYKVGKIAQNRVPFLSNQLAEEPWVKDRDWAIANNIRGFAGYPLTVGDRVIGVLAIFSHQTMAPEFLEVLQTLCMTATVALEAALKSQQFLVRQGTNRISAREPLSDQLAAILLPTRLTLVGTEHSLTPSIAFIFLKTAEVLSQLACNYCRLSYSQRTVALEAIVAVPADASATISDWVQFQFSDLAAAATCSGGTLQTQVDRHQKMIQVFLDIPYPRCSLNQPIQIQCSAPVLQAAFTHLARLSGIPVYSIDSPNSILLTDQIDQLPADRQVIWVHHSHRPIPNAIAAIVDLSLQPDQFRDVVQQVAQQNGECVNSPLAANYLLSEREQEIMTLLSQGLRDREIAQQLHISESTVKFHVNNTLTKLKARNRYQAVYQATISGWIGKAP